MPDLEKLQIEVYLQGVVDPGARIVSMKILGECRDTDIKGRGYGTPLLINYEVAGKQQHAVLHTMSPGPFGHEHMADRAQVLLWAHEAFNHLPRHVRSLDAGAFRSDGSAVALGDAEEFFILT